MIISLREAIENLSHLYKQALTSHNLQDPTKIFDKQSEDATIRQHVRLTDLFKPLYEDHSHINPTGMRGIEEYTASASIAMNNSLMLGGKWPEHQPHFKEWHEGIMRLSKDAPKLPEDVHVFSGLANADKRRHILNINAGDSYLAPAHISTSINIPVSQIFSGTQRSIIHNFRHDHFMHVKLCEGSSGPLYVGGISLHSNEMEMVIPHGTILKHVGTEDMVHDDEETGFQHRIFIHHLELPAK